jgi:hypothetical protein
VPPRDGFNGALCIDARATVMAAYRFGMDLWVKPKGDKEMGADDALFCRPWACPEDPRCRRETALMAHSASTPAQPAWAAYRFGMDLRVKPESDKEMGADDPLLRHTRA